MTNAVSLAQYGSTGVSQGFKNRIINGAMVIDQRNAGASVTVANAYTLDRWGAYANGTGAFSVQQSTTAPVGFTNSCLLTVTTADASVSGTDYYLFRQPIEGYNVADLNFGSANAKTVTISFWVRSSMAGTFGGCLRNSASNYNYPFQYVINATNTWEQKAVTIAGATAGTWLTTNGTGADLWFSIGAGSDYTDTVNVWTTKSGVVSANSSTNLISSNGETFYITGVQFEVGSSSTSFEVRDYGRELMLCQRYYFQTPNINTGSQIWDCTGLVTSTAGSIMMIPVPVTMRANPSVSINPSYNTGSFWNINIPSISNYPLTATPYLASYGGGACVPIVALTNTMPSSYIGLSCDFYCPTGTNTNNIILSAEL